MLSLLLVAQKGAETAVLRDGLLLSPNSHSSNIQLVNYHCYMFKYALSATPKRDTALTYVLLYVKLIASDSQHHYL